MRMLQLLQLAVLTATAAALLSAVGCASARQPRADGTRYVHSEDGIVRAVDPYRSRITIDERSYRVTDATRLLGAEGDPIVLSQVRPALVTFARGDRRGHVEYGGRVGTRGGELEFLRVLD